MARKKLDSLPFEIAARIPIQLGRESISSSIVAISELVKNAYDADATEVNIELVRDENEYCLLISDNGHGMDISAFQEAWLKIGTARKNSRERSPILKRIFTGAKGLGRLGLDRLSTEINLFSKVKGSTEIIELHVDWRQYEKIDSTLSSLLNDLYEHQLPVTLSNKKLLFDKKSQCGTVIKLSGLKDIWNKDYVEKLYYQLSYLATPFEEDLDFKIFLDLGVPEYNGAITSTLYLAESLLQVSASITHKEDEDGDTSYFVDMTIHDENGKLLNKPIKNLAWQKFISSDQDSQPCCGPLGLEMYFYTLSKSDFFDSVPSLQARKFIRNNYGLRIYRDKFRVLPYGEPSGKGDWLNLGDRAQSSPGGMAQGGWRVNAYQIIGAINIGREKNSLLVDQTNREGLQENSALYDLERFGISVIEKFEIAAHDHAKTVKNSNVPLVKKASENLSKANEEVVKSTSNLSNQIEQYSNTDPQKSKALKAIKDQVKKLESDVFYVREASREQERAYTEQAAELQTQKDTLSNLASIGILAIAFGHETTQDADIVSMYASDLKADLIASRIPLSQKQIASFDRLEQKASFLKGLSSFYLGTINTSKRNRKDVPPVQIAQRVFDALKPSLDRQNIEVDFVTTTHNDVYVTAFEIDFESLYVNLITNSIWALDKTPKGKRKIKIKFTPDRSQKLLLIEFSDSGKGITKTDIKSIFRPMFSTKKNRRGKQLGTGMGLFIAKNIVKDHMNGEIKAQGKGDIGGASFSILLPLSTRGRKVNA